jgi:hypothetical protein
VNIHAEGAREAITVAERNSRNEHRYRAELAERTTSCAELAEQNHTTD